MRTSSRRDPFAVYEPLVDAQNAHDVEAMLECFDPDYTSEQPAHPARAFTGTDQVRRNWSMLLGAIPDFHAKVLRTAVTGETVWSEARYSGTKGDGSRLDAMVVTIFGLREGLIVWGRLYIDEVEHDGPDINESVRDLTGTEADASSHD